MMAYDAVNEMEDLLARLNDLQLESTMASPDLPISSKSASSTTLPEPAPEPKPESNPREDQLPSTSTCPIQTPSPRTSRRASVLQRTSSLSLKVRQSVSRVLTPSVKGKERDGEATNEGEGNGAKD